MGNYCPMGMSTIAITICNNRIKKFEEFGLEIASKGMSYLSSHSAVDLENKLKTPPVTAHIHTPSACGIGRCH